MIAAAAAARHPRRRPPGAVAAVALLLGACGDRTQESPTPQYYAWPERMSYRLEMVTELQREARAVQRVEVFKVLKLTLREDLYVLVFDSVLKTSVVAGQSALLAPYAPEDTLAFYLPIGRRGEIGRVVAACDPAVRACAAALPSAIAMEMRRIVPGLPLWPVPPGGVWEDTVQFDDAARPGGTRGTFITTYGPVRDTAIGAVRYWMVPWRSVKRAFHRPPAGVGLAPEVPQEDAGLTLIDRRRLLPVIATWAGASAAPASLRAIGVEASVSRARAYLTGSPFDSALAAQQAPPPEPARGPR
jgi:hypothetical protein